MLNRLDNFFSLSQRGSNWRTEIAAGVSVFLSLAYIFVLNPAILSQAGINVSAVMFATVLASGLSTILMGLWARLPLALAPGLEMNSFFAFVVVGTMGLSWQQGLGVVFWSGVLCLVFTYIPVRQKIIDAIPMGLKNALATSVGVFVFTIGLFLADMVQFDAGLPKALGSFTSPKAQLFYMGLALSFVFVRWLKWSFGFLLAIIGATMLAQFYSIKPDALAEISPAMFSALGQADLGFVFTSLKAVMVLLILFMIDFYGSIGKFIGLTAATNLTDKDGNLVGMQQAMGVDAVGTVGGALLGTSNIITYVESAVGIAAGGRTGIVAIVAGCLMLLTIFATPLVSLVPAQAVAGVLCYVGYLLLPNIKTQSKFDVFMAVAMGLVAFITFGLDKAMLLGFVVYALQPLCCKALRFNAYIIASALLLAAVMLGQKLLG